MINESLKGFDEFKKQLHPKTNNNIKISNKCIEQKINNYKKQDQKAKRSIKDYITIDNIKTLLNMYNYKCVYCWKELNEDFTLDRINNDKSHTHDYCVISCENCNCVRGKQNYNCYYEEKCLERFHNC